MSDLPPRYVAAPTWLVYGDLPAAVYRTASRIWGLGWKHRYTRTDPIPFDDLCEICGVQRSQLYGHLRQLVSTRVLRYTNTAGKLTFHFDCRPSLQPLLDPSPENRTDAALHGVVVSSSDSETEQQQHLSKTWPTQSGKPDSESGKPDPGAPEAGRQSGKPDGGAAALLAEFLNAQVAQEVAAAFEVERVEWVVEAYRRGRELELLRGPGWIVWALANWETAQSIVAQWEEGGAEANPRLRYVSGAYAEYIQH